MPSPALQQRRGPVYRRIKQHLGCRLGERWPAGSRLPPISDLARELGAGQRNTHRAVQELVEDGFLISRPGLGTLVSPKLNARKVREVFGRPRSDQSIATSRLLAGKRIELITASASPEELVLRMIDAAADVLRLQGAAVASQARSIEQLRRLHEIEADAVMLFNMESEVRCGPRQVLSLVSTSAATPVTLPGRFDVVSVDQEQGGYLAGLQGRSGAAAGACFVGCLERQRRGKATLDATSAARLAGFQLGLGRQLPAGHVILEESYDYWSGARAMGRWLRLPQRPELIFAASDDLAVGFIIASESHGLRAGRDYQIIGFDGQRIGRKITTGALSTVLVPAEQMGARAAQLLAERLLDPDQPVRRLHLGCEFFPGKTCPQPLAAEKGEGS